MIFFLALGVRIHLHAGLIERAEAATCSYSVEVDFLQYSYSVLVAKNY